MEITTQEGSKYIIHLLAGVLSVAIRTGMTQRLLRLSVVNWALLERMRQKRVLTMAKEKVRFCFTTFSVQVMNRTYGIAVTLGGILTIVSILMMLVLTVINILGIRPSVLDYMVYV
jgi:CHASE1-domain containing sensor protein